MDWFHVKMIKDCWKFFFLQTNTLLIKTAAKKIKKNKNFCLEDNNNELKLKRNHDIYFQIQGQINIFGKEWSDFVLRRTNPYDIFVERIFRDITLRENESETSTVLLPLPAP